ncbi:MAG TPA: pitrilysin family protein [Longimicrobiaceae bacterium]|nr:pitrilysin family protein [Longimicrobiaceae bacterium]
MKRTMIAAALLAALLAPLALGAQQTAPAPERKLFPYEYTIDDLPNGLRLVTVPTDFPDLVALYIVVNTGSRNEVEPGKSGYAHFFEHMMFRGSENFTPEERDAILKRAGAEANAYTTDDRTVYHEVFSKEDLDQVIELEADRFQRLKYAEPEYRTEALAVLGEYNKNSANPISKLFETLRATAFKKHTYRHTTMGFLKDIQDMPNQYDYSLEFYRRYYRPEYTTILLVGDVTPERARALVEQHFGEWQRGDYKPEIPTEPAQDGPRTAHVEWTSPTLPYVAVAFRGPAYSDEQPDKAALDLLAQVAFGPNSELYRKLVLQEQKVDMLGASFGDRTDPELFTVIARVKNPADTEYVQQQILATFDRYTKEAIPQPLLEATRSRQRYGVAMGMNSSSSIAGALAPYIALRRTPETINRLFALYDRLTPEQIREIAARTFTENNRTIVTLAQAGQGGNR